MDKLKWIAVVIGTLVITACSDTGGPGVTTGPEDLTGRALIKGDPIAGETLTADTGFLDRSGTFSYQWLLDGEPIEGETHSTYAVDNTDIGHTITVRISLAGYAGFVPSASIGPVIDPDDPPGGLPAGLYLTALLEDPPSETGTLAGLFTWLEDSDDDHTLLPGFSYTLALGTEPETRGRINLNRDTIAPNVRLTLLGTGAGAEIELSGNGPLFSVGETITLFLENTTLKGHAANTTALVWVQGRSAVLEMHDSAIKDNTNTSEPEDGKADGHGGGVFVWKGKFAMSGTSEISGNTTKGGGGGINAGSGSTVTMSDDSVISGNDAEGSGGGVVAGADSTITMTGTSAISENISTKNGGGILLLRSTMTMSDSSEISGNTTQQTGGGVIVSWSSNFSKTGGVIYGYSSSDSKSNKAEDDNGIRIDSGHAIFVSNKAKGYPHRDITVGALENLSYTGVKNLEDREDENLGDAITTGNWTATP